MGKIFDLLGGPIKSAIEGLGGVLDKLSTTEEEKLQAKAALLVLENDLQKAIMAADVSFAQEQARVLVAEAQSASWLTRNWRPITMLTFVFIIAWNYIIAPIFGAQTLPIVPDMWDLLKIGMGGYIVGRSLEKTAPPIIEALKSNKK